MDKITNSLTVDVSNSGFVDEGDGVVRFPNGLTITDGTVQRNETRYDIDSLDLSRYGNQLTGDHVDTLGNIIGRTEGVVKTNGRVVVNKIVYAVSQSPYARLAYDLLVGGFSKNFSTETIGPAPDVNGVYWNAELVGLSQVVTQNNYNASINKLVHNSLEKAKQDGLDVAGIEDKVLPAAQGETKNNMDEKPKEDVTEPKVTVEEVPADESTKVQAPAVEEAGENGEKIVETPHAPASTEVAGTVQADEEAQADKAENNTDKTEETPKETDKTDDTAVKTEEVTPEQKETNKKEDTEMSKDENTVALTAEQITEIIANALAPVTTELAAVKEQAKNAFDASAKEPTFKKDDNAAPKADEETPAAKFAAMNHLDRYQEQVTAAWNAVRTGSIEAKQTLQTINQVNLDALKEKGIAQNAITLEDLGNFVIAPEMYSEIQGQRTDYTAILDATEWRETNSLEFAWQERVGDIDMRNVALNATDADPDANLKPISEYRTVPRKSELEELAAVTVVANSATRFFAADLLADAAAGYRNDFDRKKAQLVIARLEQAVDANGFSQPYAPASDVDALTDWIDAVTQLSDTTLQGTLIFNARTMAELTSRALKAGANGPLSSIFQSGSVGPTVFGHPYVIVPNDLMPSLGGGEDIRHEVYGVDVRINHAVFFADLSTFTGRTSGGLQYDVSNDASYEVDGVVRSAYQRNELVLRGSFYRGGEVKDRRVVAGVRQGAGANVS